MLALSVGGCTAAGSATPPPLAPLASPAAAPDRGAGEEGTESFDDAFGHFVHAGGGADVAARDAAIEEAIADIFFLGRGFARDKLLAAAHIDAWIDLSRQDQTITVQLEERFTLSAELGGAGVNMVGTDGDDLTLTFRRRGGALVQLAQGERGGTRRVFVAEQGGLIVHVAIFATQLPRPVEFELHYDRVGGS